MRKLTISLLICAVYALGQGALANPSGKSDKMIPLRKEVRRLLVDLGPSLRGEVLYIAPEDAQKRAFARVLSLASKSARARALVVVELIAIFKDKRLTPNTRVCAAHVLADLKAVEAIGELVKGFDLKTLLPSLLNLNTAPVLQAVVSMGEPAIPQLAEALGDDEAIVRKNSATALGLIGGSKARLVLEAALSKEKDADVIASIKEGLVEVGRRSN